MLGCPCPWIADIHRFIPTRENSAHAAFQLLPETGDQYGGMTPGRKVNHGQGTDVDVRRGRSIPLNLEQSLTYNRRGKPDIHDCSQRRDVSNCTKPSHPFSRPSTTTIAIPPRSAPQTNDIPHHQYTPPSWQSPRIVRRPHATPPLSTSRHGKFSRERKGRFPTFSCCQPSPPSYACTHNTYIRPWSSSRRWSLVIALSSASITSSLDFGSE